MLRVRHRDQLFVTREALHARMLRVLVHPHRWMSRPDQVEGGALIARKTYNSELVAEGEACLVCRRQIGRWFVGIAAKALPPPAPKLIAMVVIEPPNPVTARVKETGGCAIRPIGNLAVAAGLHVPFVELRFADQVGGVEHVLWIAGSPIGKR